MIVIHCSRCLDDENRLRILNYVFILYLVRLIYIEINQVKRKVVRTRVKHTDALKIDSSMLFLDERFIVQSRTFVHIKFYSSQTGSISNKQ